jgi:hypothetical protein
MCAQRTLPTVALVFIGILVPIGAVRADILPLDIPAMTGRTPQQIQQILPGWHAEPMTGKKLGLQWRFTEGDHCIRGGSRTPATGPKRAEPRVLIVSFDGQRANRFQFLWNALDEFAPARDYRRLLAIVGFERMPRPHLSFRLDQAWNNIRGFERITVQGGISEKPSVRPCVVGILIEQGLPARNLATFASQR